MNKFTLLFVGLLFSACGAPPVDRQDVRFSGPTYFMQSTLNLTPDQCGQLCEEDGSDCAGWRYEKPTAEEPLATCVLLEKIEAETSDPCCLSAKASPQQTDD
ncbi:MAG: hypothetical protein COA47_00790 [Robiginitomaculum sp.]|nr:MAG: hypothetical protein COA47_00790 [Robiginitomaculum sp.]